jgi:hypothetical protein
MNRQFPWSLANECNFLDWGRSPQLRGEEFPWEAAGRSTGQEILCLLRNPKFHYRVHKILSPDTILSQFNSLHIPTPYFFSTC